MSRIQLYPHKDGRKRTQTHRCHCLAGNSALSPTGHYCSRLTFSCTAMHERPKVTSLTGSGETLQALARTRTLVKLIFIHYGSKKHRHGRIEQGRDP